MTRRVEGKVALVTGGASRPGLGSAIALRLAEEGAHVILSDVDLAGAEQTAAKITALNLDAKAVYQDVSLQEDWDRVIADITNTHGRLDILVNNAGILDVGEIDDDGTVAGLKRQLSVNVEGVFMGTQAAVKAMRAASTAGSIVNISSIAGLVGFKASASYAATKGAVKMMTKSVALETAAEGIRVNSVHPGIIRTNMAAAGLDDNAENYAAIEEVIPMHRLGEPEDIANCVLFLASDEARYVTGAEFVVDGGYTTQ
uniref:SDR family NAD(P)-dependent oxidoreductase n=1 Tax=uncultured Altererythrobacter sp. TaxID=500840 RepID=UPI0026228A06|nr:glucose 1-dehydrogenase [uncultured Altererythrobacter sp.]